MKRDTSIGFRINSKLKIAAEEAAKEDMRSLASWIESLMAQTLIGRGLLPKDWNKKE